VAEALSDWKVQVILDRKAIVHDITMLAQVLARERIFYLVAASSREEAMKKGKRSFVFVTGAPERYVRSLNPRKLPT
jgi:hypothetical protein